MPLPAAMLDDLEWDELFETARIRIPANAPRWTDHNVHDPGITILDLLAWIAEQSSFRIDQIPDSHRVRFAALLGEQSHTATAATAVLELTSSTSDQVVSAGNVVHARSESGVTPFFTERAGRATSVRISQLATDGVEQPPRTAFEPLGSDGVAEFLIQFDRPVPAGRLYLWAESANEPPGPGSGSHHSVRLRWELLRDGVWEQLPEGRVEDETAALSRSGLIVLELPSTRSVRCRLDAGRYDRAPRLTAIVPNAVIARQVAVTSLTAVAPSNLRIDLGSRGVQAVWVASSHEGGVLWTVRRNPEREPDQPVVLFHPQSGSLVFSDGRWGRRPYAGELFNVWIVHSMGRAGNVGTEAEWSLPAHPEVSANAPWGAQQGADAELTSDAIVRAAGRMWAHERLADLAARRGVPSLDGLARSEVDAAEPPARAVTALDYERLALATPGVSLARARAWIDRDLAVPCALAPGTVSLVVVPYLPVGHPAPTQQLVSDVFDFLAARKTLGTKLHVRGPRYTPVEIEVTVVVASGTDPARVTRAAEDAIRSFLDPLRGGPEGRGWPFGRDVYRSEIMATVSAVPGVEIVTDVVLGANEGCSNLCVPATDLVAVATLSVVVER